MTAQQCPTGLRISGVSEGVRADILSAVSTAGALLWAQDRSWSSVGFFLPLQSSDNKKQKSHQSKAILANPESTVLDPKRGLPNLTQ